MSETLAHFVAVCPKCLVSLRVPHAFSGRSVRCNQCSHKFRTFSPDFPPPPISDEYTTGTLNVNATSSEANPLTVVCPNCKAFLGVRRSSAGHYVRCRNCSHKFLIPNTGTSPEEPNQQSHEANLVKQLFRNLEDTKAGEEPHRAGPVFSQSEHATVSGLLDRILTEFSMMVEDRDRIQSELVTLLARFKKLRGKYERLKLEREKDRLEHHRLDAELATLREALTASHDAREQISRQGQDLRDQLETVHAERDQFYQGLHERDEALKSARAKLEEFDQQLRQRCDELSTKQSELERLAGERQATLSNTEKLHTTFAQREQELSLESDQRRVEIEVLRRTLDEVGQRHRDDQSQLAKQLRLMREQLDSAESQVAALQARNNELLDDRMKLETDHHAILESERSRLSAEFQSVLDADRSRRAEQLALIQASSDENAQLAHRLKAEISTLAESRTTLEDGLEAARSEIEELRRKLAEKEDQGRSVSALLGQMGIQVN